MSRHWSAWILLSLLGLCALGCDPGEGQRFLDQEPWYRFDGQLFRMTVRGARLVSTTPEVVSGYTCPAGDVLTPEVTVFSVEALSPTPLLEIESLPQAVDCASVEPFAVELAGLPIDALDLYRRCDADATERYVNRCASGLVVESCTGSDPVGACELVVEGRYELVTWSEVLDDRSCRNAREAQQSVVEACQACNAFEPEPVLTVALRSSTPEVSETDDTLTCCDPEVVPQLVFCARPCTCRRTFVSLRPKTRAPTALPLQNDEDGALRLAVLSDIESNKPMFTKFVAQARERGVDAVVSIGDLTDSGGQGGVRGMAEFVRERLTFADGSGCAEDADGRLCCPGGERLFPELCNAPLQRQGMMNGLGRNETDEDSFFTFFQEFGPSNYTTTIGHVQLVVVDSANGTLSNAQFEWLEEVLRTLDPDRLECSLFGSPPGGGSEWPLASACSGDCTTCGLNQNPLCVPPPIERSDFTEGDQNCMCLESESRPCPGNLQCLDLDGDGRTRCACDRDASCGPGGRCVEGACEPPLRLVFTHTPPFDHFGARNQAFLSRREAARFMSTLSEANVALLFAGAINTFREVSAAGVPLFITGGGGADLEAFDETGHHWLLVTIPRAWDAPSRGELAVEVVALDD